jgi:hypothetical protein
MAEREDSVRKREEEIARLEEQFREKNAGNHEDDHGPQELPDESDPPDPKD